MKTASQFIVIISCFVLPLFNACQNTRSVSGDVQDKSNARVNEGNHKSTFVIDTFAIDSICNKTDVISAEDPISVDTFYFSQLDSILITLEARFSSGRLWMVEEQDSMLNLVNQWETREKKQEKLVDYQTFHFSSEKEGLFPVLFIRKRPFLEIDSTAVYNKTYINVDRKWSADSKK